MSSSKVKNMTEGNPLKLILFFSLPLMAGNVCQQLYTVVDTAIVGKVLGVESLAALGSVDWLNWLFIGVVHGITQGFSILTAQRFGAGDIRGMRKANGNALILCLFCSLFLLFLSQSTLPAFFAFLKVPEEIIPIGSLYIRILFAGIPIVMAYNIFSCFLRSVGDARTPLYAMILASGANIALDLLFVVVFRWGVAGAAAATVMAQLFSAIFCLLKIRKIEVLHMSSSDFSFSAGISRTLGRLASPMAFQNLVIAVGGMIIMTVVNRQGVPFIAGYTATNKLYGVLEVAAISYGYAMVTYSGQNYGAGKKERISQGVRAGLFIAMITSILIMTLMFTCGRWILGLFIDQNSNYAREAVEVGFLYLKLMSAFLPILYVLHIVRSCIQGMGNTVIPMMSGFAEFIMRTACVLILPNIVGTIGIFISEIAAWTGADLVLVPGYFLQKAAMKPAEKSISG